jgi:nucleoside-diphosphate-sugar epimerase
MIENYVTGASGFIGKHLMKKLKGESTAIEHGQMAYMDCRNLFFLSTYGNMASHTDVEMMIDANTRDVIWWINSHLVKNWFCYMSSSSVTLPVQTPYSRTKRAAEEILQALPELKSCIVRPFSVTGCGEQKEHLIPTLIRSCMEGEVMPFDPLPVHDFVDVSDVVDALVNLSENKVTGIVELGNGYGYSNQEVLQLVELVTGKKANLQTSHISLRSYDNKEWYCKNPFFRKPKPLLKSIEEMVAAYRGAI